MEILLGQTTAEVVTYICQNPHILAVTLASYEPPEGYNNHFIDDITTVARDELVAPGWVARVRQKIPVSLFPGQLGFAHTYPCIGSILETTEGERHIPMLDYDSNAKSLEERNIKGEVRSFKRILKAMGYPQGVILNSGEGLHYLGLRLLNENGFSALTKRLRDYTNSFHRGIGGVDSRWVQACSDLDFFVLRLEAAGDKPKTPEVIDSFRPHYPPDKIGILEEEWRALNPEERPYSRPFQYYLETVEDFGPDPDGYRRTLYLFESGVTISGRPLSGDPIGAQLLRVMQPVGIEGGERNIGVFQFIRYDYNERQKTLEIPSDYKYNPICSELWGEERARLLKKILSEIPFSQVIIPSPAKAA